VESFRLLRPAQAEPDAQAASAQAGKLLDYRPVFKHSTFGGGGVNLVKRQVIAQQRAALRYLPPEHGQ
jgi:hypothetical protein